MVDILVSYWIFLASIPPFEIPPLPAPPAAGNAIAQPIWFILIVELTLMIQRGVLLLSALESYSILRVLRRLAEKKLTPDYLLGVEVYQNITLKAVLYALISMALTMLPATLWWLELGINMGMVCNVHRGKIEGHNILIKLKLLTP